MRRSVVLAATLLAACMDGTGPGQTGDYPHALYFFMPPFTLVPGQTRQLIVEGTKDGIFIFLREVSYTSLDTSIATVNSKGVVRARGVGDAVIRAVSGIAIAELRVPVRKSICSGTSSEGIIVPGAEVSGTIGILDCGIATGGTADGWELTLTEPTTILAELTEGWPEFKVWLTNLDMEEVGKDTVFRGPLFEFAEPWGVRAARTLPAGEYRVWVSENEAPSDVSYTLRLSTAPVCGPAVTTPFPLGTTIDTGLDATECVLPDGGRADGWSIPGDGGFATVRMEGTGAFQPAIALTTASLGAVERSYTFQNDGEAVEYIYKLLGTTTRYLWARAADTLQRTGPYAVTARRTPLCDPNNPTPLVLGVEVVDTVGVNDCVIVSFGSGSVFPADPWSFTVASTTTLQVDLTLTGEIVGWAYYGVGVSLTLGGPQFTGVVSQPAPGVRRMELVLAPGTYHATVSVDVGRLPYALTVRVKP